MKEHPVLFSTPMVRAILEGRKTQTRRVVKGFKNFDQYQKPGEINMAPPSINNCPYGQPGDRLWVRETWAKGECDLEIYYRATDKEISFEERANGMRWRPSIYMPRWASRITLEITDVRVQRLQDISCEDARLEGPQDRPPNGRGNGGTWESYTPSVRYVLSPRESFKGLWDSINAARGYGWDTNPWVWAVSFKRVEPPCK